MNQIEGDLRDYRVTRERPCPVCERPDWCLSDGEGWAVCARVESESRWGDAGWFHRLRESFPLAPVARIMPAKSLSKAPRISSAFSSSPDKLAAVHVYHDEAGEAIYRKLRFERAEGGKHFRFQRFDGWDKTTRPWKGLWFGGRGCMDRVRRVLYHLDQIIARPTARVFITEGEKAADLLFDLGILATTNDDGAGKWRPEYSQALRGREVVIMPDNDPPGAAHGELVARSLYGVALSIKIVQLPGLGLKGDVADWMNDGEVTA